MPAIEEVPLALIAPLREELRAAAACQIVHDSRYERRGWCTQYLLKVGGATAGFAGLAAAGPWRGRRTLFDFHVRPAHRGQWPALWAAVVEASRADSYELQTNLPLVPELLAALGSGQQTERILYGAGRDTALPASGATLRCLTPAQETQLCLRERAGQCQWVLELDGAKVGEGALLFHYNVPYADIAMDIHATFRRRGLGAYLVQELKRHARELGAVPAARTSPENIASQRTLEKAGMVRVGTIVAGPLEPR